jgi:hypothetical protein
VVFFSYLAACRCGSNRFSGQTSDTRSCQGKSLESCGLFYIFLADYPYFNKSFPPSFLPHPPTNPGKPTALSNWSERLFLPRFRRLTRLFRHRSRRVGIISEINGFQNGISIICGLFHTPNGSPQSIQHEAAGFNFAFRALT